MKQAAKTEADISAHSILCSLLREQTQPCATAAGCITPTSLLLSLRQNKAEQEALIKELPVWLTRGSSFSEATRVSFHPWRSGVKVSPTLSNEVCCWNWRSGCWAALLIRKHREWRCVCVCGCSWWWYRRCGLVVILDNEPKKNFTDVSRWFNLMCLNWKACLM